MRFSMEMGEQETARWLQMSKTNSWERDRQLSVVVLSYIDRKSGIEGNILWLRQHAKYASLAKVKAKFKNPKQWIVSCSK